MEISKIPAENFILWMIIVRLQKRKYGPSELGKLFGVHWNFSLTGQEIYR
jgi:hypothetical protein